MTEEEAQSRSLTVVLGIVLIMVMIITVGAVWFPKTFTHLSGLILSIFP